MKIIEKIKSFFINESLYKEKCIYCNKLSIVTSLIGYSNQKISKFCNICNIEIIFNKNNIENYTIRFYKESELQLYLRDYYYLMIVNDTINNKVYSQLDFIFINEQYNNFSQKFIYNWDHVIPIKDAKKTVENIIENLIFK